jgi:hypothetical protein
VEISSFVPPLAEFSLGTGKVAHFVVSGLDASDAVKVRGRSLMISPAGFAGSSLDLFVSRAGSFARPPGELATAPGEHAPSTVLGGRFLLLGGPGGRIDGYDFGVWRPVQAPPPLDCAKPPCDIRSLAVIADTVALAIGDEFALWFDPVHGGTADATKPAGLASWADVAGGETILGSDGSAFVVGATRPSGATSAVLHVLEDGTLELLSTSSPRAGAAATWVDGRGLCVVGGGDDQAAGAELMAEGAKAFTPLAYAADPVVGAGAIALDASTVLRIGGKDSAGKAAPTVELSLGCGAGCQPKGAGDPFDATRVHAFFSRSGAILVVGDGADGQTVAARFEDGKLTSVPLREPRTGAAALALPTGHVAIAGGSAATTLELFIE